MNKHRLLLIASVLGSISNPIFAETFSYTSASVAYEILTVETDISTEDLEGDGININLSADISSNIALTAGYGEGSVDLTSGGSTLVADIDAWGIGVLYHTPINTVTDVVAGLNIIQGNIDYELNGTPLTKEDANGNAIYIGIRTMVSSNVEFNTFIDRSDIENCTETDIEFGVAYYINKNAALTFDYLLDSDTDSLEFGITKYF